MSVLDAVFIITDQVLFIDADGLFFLSFFPEPVSACPTDG